ncbi:MAG: hypothetical protein IH965_09960 [Gemmatimonadetes bacterium]|nr:hypothetical protein [Gemmatimonadota bacterium]
MRGLNSIRNASFWSLDGSAILFANTHAPNEYMVINPREGFDIAGLAEIEKAYVDLLFAFGRIRPQTE